MSGPLAQPDLSPDAEAPVGPPCVEVTASRHASIGALEVSRALPHRARRTVGAWCFLDHMLPTTADVGIGPHPHIGLHTVTWLLEGELLHRDGLGSEQAIRPGQLNLMTAGRGIAHSERTPATLREGEHPVHGMQTWLALPRADEETAPAFHHHPAATLPRLERGGALLRVLAGRGFGAEAPVRVFADTLYVAIDLAPGAAIPLEDAHAERALYLLDGDARLDGTPLPARHLVLLERGTRPVLEASTPVKAMLLGGEPLDATRHLWWNFVSSSTERIEQAKQDWLEGRFGRVPGDDEFIPLPER